MTHKAKLHQPPLLCNYNLAKRTLLLMLMLNFRMCNILKFTQTSFTTYFLLSYLLAAVLFDDTIV